MFRLWQFQHNLPAGAALLQQLMRFGDFVQAEDFGIQWLNMLSVNQFKHRIDDFLCREIAEEAREEHAVGDVFDGVEMLDGEDVSEDARVADIARLLDAPERILQSGRPDEFQDLVRAHFGRQTFRQMAIIEDANIRPDGFQPVRTSAAGLPNDSALWLGSSPKPIRDALRGRGFR